MRVRVADIPAYLRSSCFYKNLHTDAASDAIGSLTDRHEGSECGVECAEEEDDTDDISIPEAFMRLDPAIHSTEDLQHLLRTLQFWGADCVPDELLSYALAQQEPGASAAVKDALLQFTDVVPQIPAVLKFLELEEGQRNPRQGYQAMKAAAKSGDVRLMRYVLRNHKQQQQQCDSFTDDSSLWTSSVCTVAIQSCSIDCLDFALQHGCPWCLNSCYCAMQLLRRNEPRMMECILLHGAPLPEWEDAMHCIMRSIAGRGHLRCLQLAHERGVQWDATTLVHAAASGHLHCIEYAAARGCPLDPAAVTATAIRHNQIAVLQYAAAHGFPMVEGGCALAAEEGNLPALECLHAVCGCAMDVAVVNRAAQLGHLDCLRYACAQGAAMDAAACDLAAYHNRLDCLQLLHRSGCPWTASCCREAVRRGNLRCLRYAREHGCLWDEAVLVAAVEVRAEQCALYCLQHGCPLPEQWRGGVQLLRVLNARGLFQCIDAAKQRCQL